MKPYINTIFFSILLLLPLSSVLGQDYTQPQKLAKTTADVTPPQYFEAATQFQGYIHTGTSSTILLQELAGTSYLLIKRGMTPDYFAQEGFKYISEEEVVTNTGLKGILYRMGFTVQETEFERLMLFTGDYHRTFWLIANYPTMVSEQMYPEMKKSLLTLKP